MSIYQQQARMKVKICGITSLEDAEIALAAGADALGFVFYPRSPRRISVREAKRIIQSLPVFVEKVGVFVDGSPDEIDETCRSLKLTLAQLSGDVFTSGVVRRFRIPVMRAFRVNESFNACVAYNFLKRSKTTTVLLDTYDAKLHGGTGRCIDREKAKGLVKEISEFGYVVLAGGLTPSNVAETIEAVRPFGVDVASGVEKEAGKKDPEKVRAFVENAKAAFQRLETQSAQR
ncbi:MAG: phosphoribosylanthranilate isomerase [Chloroherpetonaceae bacterium]|nr:phosphoribosylanthranilate isomerase [Chloroherpetonaceae bacterium]MDW8020276.1 phosphoribosylanthranilate isomerase [Chloroherpetonaceae bacterium]